MNNVSQQLGSAIGVPLISTFVATATANYLRHHGSEPAVRLQATVHGFTVGYWWAAAVYLGAAVVCGLLIRPHVNLHHAPADHPPLDEHIPVSA